MCTWRNSRGFNFRIHDTTHYLDKGYDLGKVVHLPEIQNRGPSSREKVDGIQKNTINPNPAEKGEQENAY